MGSCVIFTSKNLFIIIFLGMSCDDLRRCDFKVFSTALVASVVLLLSVEGLRLALCTPETVEFRVATFSLKG